MELKDLLPIAIIMTVLVIVLAMTSNVLTEIRANQFDTDSTIENQTASTTCKTLTYPIKSVTSVVNASNTSQALTTPADYNVTVANLDLGLDDKGCIKVSSTWNGKNITVNYEYYKTTIASNISTSGLEGGLEIGQWQPMIALIVVAAIIIGIIITAFAFGRRR